jgi:hypothetical protein
MALFTGSPGTLLGPLTTTIALPDHCDINVLDCTTCSFGFRGQQCGTAGENIAKRPMDDASCWPPALKAAETPQQPFLGWGFYSPGLACPTGYTAACSARFGGRSEWDVQFTLVPGETAVGCCPTYVGLMCHPQTFLTRSNKDLC